MSRRKTSPAARGGCNDELEEGGHGSGVRQATTVRETSHSLCLRVAKIGAGKLGMGKGGSRRPSSFCDRWRRGSPSDDDGDRVGGGSTVTIGLSSLGLSYQPILTITDLEGQSERGRWILSFFLDVGIGWSLCG
jgi:hypothetical protein